MKWYEWTRHVRDHCDAPPDVKALLLTLSTYADADGRCYPSLATLAEKLSVHADTAKRRRNRAVQLGWLQVESPGRWKGAATRYRLSLKGCTHAPLRATQRGASKGAKGVHGAAQRGAPTPPERLLTFHEGDDGAPSREARTSPTVKRRELARAIREAKSPVHRDLFVATFRREYGHLYPERGAAA